MMVGVGESVYEGSHKKKEEKSIKYAFSERKGKNPCAVDTIIARENGKKTVKAKFTRRKRKRNVNFCLL